MTEMTPVQELRAAAKLMRERAALLPQPPWYRCEGEIGTREPFSVISQSGITDWALYIASWHPGVALAVAGLLDKIAWMGELDAEMLGRVGCDEAIAIARAYLGSKGNDDA